MRYRIEYTKQHIRDAIRSYPDGFVASQHSDDGWKYKRNRTVWVVTSRDRDGWVELYSRELGVEVRELSPEEQLAVWA